MSLCTLDSRRGGATVPRFRRLEIPLLGEAEILGQVRNLFARARRPRTAPF